MVGSGPLNSENVVGLLDELDRELHRAGGRAELYLARPNGNGGHCPSSRPVVSGLRLRSSFFTRGPKALMKRPVVSSIQATCSSQCS